MYPPKLPKDTTTGPGAALTIVGAVKTGKKRFGMSTFSPSQFIVVNKRLP